MNEIFSVFIIYESWCCRYRERHLGKIKNEAGICFAIPDKHILCLLMWKYPVVQSVSLPRSTTDSLFVLGEWGFFHLPYAATTLCGISQIDAFPLLSNVSSASSSAASQFTKVSVFSTPVCWPQEDLRGKSSVAQMTAPLKSSFCQSVLTQSWWHI